jgi:hypothetical protein
MPIYVLHKKVKNKWNVDVHVSSLYRAKKKKQENPSMGNWMSSTIICGIIAPWLGAIIMVRSNNRLWMSM